MSTNEWGFVEYHAPGFENVVIVVADDLGVTRDYVFFHHEANRGLRVDASKLVCSQEEDNAWELLDLATDRCEQQNLAASQPDRVREMSGRWRE